MRTLLLLPPCFALLCSASAAWAEPDTPFTLTASGAVQTDSNLFRLPSSSDAFKLLGRDSAAEQVGITTVGLNFASTQSLQRFEVNASLVDYRYQNFGYLSFAARNFDAAWRWSLTPRFTGSLTSDRKETLNSFADYQGFTKRNQRTDTSTRLDTTYELTGPWRVLLGAAQNEQSNEQALVAGGDYRSTGAHLGVRQDFGSGSTLGYTARLANGSYLNRVLPSTGLYDDTFRQIDHELRLRWALGGASSVDAHLTALSRSHPTYASRDYDGFASGLALKWAVTGKSVLNAAYAHELSDYATANSNYAQTDRLTLGAVWSLSPKLQLGLRTAWSQVDYLGTPTAVLANQRRDTTHDTALTLAWQPYQRFSLTAALLSASRSSSQLGLDFDSTSATLAAQYSY